MFSADHRDWITYQVAHPFPREDKFSLSQQPLMACNSSSRKKGLMRFTTCTLACQVMLSLCRSWLEDLIAETSWVQLPRDV